MANVFSELADVVSYSLFAGLDSIEAHAADAKNWASSTEELNDHYTSGTDMAGAAQALSQKGTVDELNQWQTDNLGSNHTNDWSAAELAAAMQQLAVDQDTSGGDPKTDGFNQQKALIMGILQSYTSIVTSLQQQDTQPGTTATTRLQSVITNDTSALGALAQAVQTAEDPLGSFASLGQML